MIAATENIIRKQRGSSVNIFVVILVDNGYEKINEKKRRRRSRRRKRKEKKEKKKRKKER